MEPLPVVDHEQLSATEERIARVLLGPFHEWNPDMAMRYLPIIRIIKAENLLASITDVGSGGQGIAPYVRRRVTGIDTDFSPRAHPLLDPLNRSVLETGLEDRSRPCVISVDMLEHLPSDLRPQAVAELVRIAGRLLIVAVPAGAGAEAQDRQLAERYKHRRKASFRFLDEHIENGLPGIDEFRVLIDDALKASGRTATLEMLGNANLRVRGFVAGRWVNQRIHDKVAWVLLTWLSGPLSRANWGETYRTLAIVRFNDTP